MRVRTLLFTVSLLSLPLSMRADNFYYTQANGAFYTNGTDISQPSQGNWNNNTVLSATPPSGSGLSGSVYAEADRGSLHATVQSNGCYSSCGTSYGEYASTGYEEYGVQAVGASDLLQGIASYKFTFNVDGSWVPGSNTDMPAFFSGWVFQNGSGYGDAQQSVTYYADPAGSLSFYFNVPDPTQPFDFYLFLAEDVRHQSSGSIDLAISLASVVALNAGGNVIPGVELELGDGTYLGANGYSTSLNQPPTTQPATTPEPSTFVMLSTGILGAAAAVRRRLTA